jgi:ADP-ribosylglycohydrolase
MGWVLIALQNAFYHLLASDLFRSGVTETILQGGDTDTNACITGALIGAVEGISQIDWELVGPLLSCRPHAQTRRPRPLDYWPDDAGALVRQLVAYSPC